MSLIFLISLLQLLWFSMALRYIPNDLKVQKRSVLVWYCNLFPAPHLLCPCHMHWLFLYFPSIFLTLSLSLPFPWPGKSLLHMAENFYSDSCSVVIRELFWMNDKSHEAVIFPVLFTVLSSNLESCQGWRHRWICWVLITIHLKSCLGGWGYKSMVKHVFNMFPAVDSVPSTARQRTLPGSAFSLL